MVICRPAREPFGSPPQFWTQPPSPSMMLGPAVSSATGAGLGVGFDLLFHPRNTPPAVTTRQMAMTSFPLRDPMRELFLSAWMDAKVGIVSEAAAAAVFSGAVDAGAGAAGLVSSFTGSAGGVAGLAGDCGLAAAGL